MSRQWNPLQDLMVLQDRMTRLFEDVTQRGVPSENQRGDEVETADWYPAADIAENDNQYVITVDLPGIDRSTLEISVDDNRLAIRGLRTIATPANQRVERPRGRFLRSFGVPSSVDQSKIGADYKDGVLSVILPKLTEQKAKKIEIKIT